MDWKTKTLLFVLVLFGSVVPASAQEGSGTTADVWAIMGAGVVLLGVILATWGASRADNREAHKGIRENIGRVESKVDKVESKVEKVEGKVEKVEGKVDAGFTGINNDIKDLNRSIGRLEGRPSETRQD